MTEQLNSAMDARIYRLVRLGFLALVAAFAFLAAASTPAMAQNCSASMNFSAIGDTQTQSLQSCNTFLQPTEFDSSNARWAGLQSASGARVRGPANCGIGVSNGTGSCNQPSPATVSTSNATYAITGNSATSLFQLKLVSRSSSAAFTDTLTYSTYVGSGAEIQPTTNTLYEFSLNVAAEGGSSDATLSNLVLSAGAVDPAFASNTTSYTVDVATATASTTLTPSASDDGTTITVNGTPVASGNASDSIDLDVGPNIITVVTVSGSETKTYTVTVNREASPTPTITEQPSDQTVAAGASATFHVALTGTTGSLIFKWQYRPSGGVWLDFSSDGTAAGVTTDTLTLTPPLELPMLFDDIAVIARVSGGNISGTLDSNAATLTVNSAGEPSITTVSPDKGTTAGGTTVTITGTGFTDATGVSFGATPASSFTVVNATKITAVTASHDAGVANVAVTTAGGTDSLSNGFAYTEPLFIFSPVDGALNAGTVGAAYIGSGISASGGTGNLSYAVTGGAIPDGLTLHTDGSWSGAPNEAGPFSFMVTVTDANNDTGTADYTLEVVPTPVSSVADLSGLAVSPGTLTPAFAAGTTGYTLTVPFGTSAVTVQATAADTNARVGFDGGVAQPGVLNESYPLEDDLTEITVVVMAPDETSKVYTVTVTRNSALPSTPDAVSISPEAGALPPGKLGEFYSQQFTVSGGVGPFQFTLGGDRPPSMTLDADTGVFSGAPSAAYAFESTVIVIDKGNADAETSFDYTWVVADGSSPSFVFTPAGGTLPDAMPGEDYGDNAVAITAAGGVAPLHYKVSQDALPDGLELDETTGALTGTVAVDAELKDYAFTVTVTDASEASGTAEFTLNLIKREITAPDKSFIVPAGSTPLPVDLEKGATGGPFTKAAVAFVEPANAGRADIILGEVADASSVPVDVRGMPFKLRFIPDPAFSGTAVVGYTLINEDLVGVTTASGTVTYNLGVNVPATAAQIESLVHGFVSARQGMIASTIAVPGLLERRRMGTATDPVTGSFSPSGDGLDAQLCHQPGADECRQQCRAQASSMSATRWTLRSISGPTAR